jgi:dCTP deaminase
MVVMEILSNRDLRMYIDTDLLKVDPLYSDVIRENGLDLRIGPEILRLHASDDVLDTRSGKGIEGRYTVESGLSFVINPRERILCRTQEYIEMSNDLVGFCELRVTYSLLGLSIPPTMVDAGFPGTLTIEMISDSGFPIRFYHGDRFMHVIFSKLTSKTEKPYQGKYKGQLAVTPPILDSAVKKNSGGSG